MSAQSHGTIVVNSDTLPIPNDAPTVTSANVSSPMLLMINTLYLFIASFIHIHFYRKLHFFFFFSFFFFHTRNKSSNWIFIQLCWIKFVFAIGMEDLSCLYLVAFVLDRLYIEKALKFNLEGV